MDIKIENFRNIKDLNFCISKNKLTLIHSHNGMGKTSISLALQSTEDNIDDYTSFLDWGTPFVQKEEGYNYIAYDENFINYVKDDNNNPLDNAYELIFKDDSIVRLEAKIEEEKRNIIEIMKIDELQELRKESSKLCKGLKLTAGNNLSNTQQVKAIKSPAPESVVKDSVNLKKLYNNQNDRVAYTSWKIQGKKFEQNNNACPYCTQDMTPEVMDLNKSFNEKIDKNHIKNKEELQGLFKSISRKIILRTDKINLIVSGRHKLKNLSNEQVMKLAIKKLSSVEETLKQIDNIQYMHHNSEYERIQVDKRYFRLSNSTVSSLVDRIEEYNKKISKINTIQKGIVKKIEKKIKTHNNDIESIFKSCGINYVLNFEKDDNYNVKAKLKHKSSNLEITNLEETLSFGERNLISIILFCLYSKSNNGNVIIFDDPSTLFDLTKRFMFINLLICRNNFKLINKRDYVILLTHDFETFKDFAVMKQEKKYYNKLDSRILNNIDGICTMREIKPSNFKYYIENISDCIEKSNILIVKLIYLRKLIYVGHIKDTSNKIYNFISSISKYKEPQTKQQDRIYTSVENNDIVESIIGTEYIKDTEFQSYDYLWDSISLRNVMNHLNGKLMWFERLILFRLLGFYLSTNNIKIESVDPIVMKFITQCFHVEDDHLYDLSYINENPIPRYINELVNKLVEDIEQELVNKAVL